MKLYLSKTCWQNILSTTLVIMILSSCMTENNNTIASRSSSPFPIVTSEPFQKGFPIKIPDTNNCQFSSISRNNQWIVILCNDHYDQQTQRYTYSIWVSKIQPVEWVHLFTGADALTHYTSTAFSPDGTKLAVSDIDKIWVLEVGKWEEQRVLTCANFEGYLYWSPNNKYIAVRVGNGRVNSGEPLLSLLSLDGTYQTLLTWDDVFPAGIPDEYKLMPLYETGISWSPDGKRIAYVAYLRRENNPGENQLWVLDVESSKRTLLLTGNIGTLLAWSPDGEKIAIYDENSIQVFDVGTDELMTLLKLPEPVNFNRIDSGILWSSDSIRIVVHILRQFGEESGLYLINLGNKTIVRLGTSIPLLWIENENALIIEDYFTLPYIIDVLLINKIN